MRDGCICPIGAIQNVTLTAFDSSYAIPLAAAAFFVVPLVFTLFFGRVFCGAVCPLGAIQDAVLIRPVAVPRWLESGLRLLAYTYLGAAVLFAATGSAFLICRYDPFVGFFRLSGNWNILILGVSLLVIGLFVGPAVLPLPVPVRRDPAAPVPAVQVARDDHAQRVHQVPPVRGRLPVRRDPRADRRLARRRVQDRQEEAGLCSWCCCRSWWPAAVWGGYALKEQLARMHPRVRTAERVYLEETGKVMGTTNVSDAFRATGQTTEVLYADATEIRNRFGVGGAMLGAFIGLGRRGQADRPFGSSPAAPSTRRIPAGCFACGRCYQVLSEGA